MDQLVRIIPSLIFVVVAAKCCSYDPKSKVQKKSNYASKSKYASKAIESPQNEYMHRELVLYDEMNYVMNAGISNDGILIIVMLIQCDPMIAQLIYKYLHIPDPNPWMTVSTQSTQSSQTAMITIYTNINNPYLHSGVCSDVDKYRHRSSVGMLCINANSNGNNKQSIAAEKLWTPNPNAAPFIPSSSAHEIGLPLTSYQHDGGWKSLPVYSFQELKQFHMKQCQRLNKKGKQNRFAVMFIPQCVTRKAVPEERSKAVIKEYFYDYTKLFQYLKYMLIIKVINRDYKIFERAAVCNKNGKDLKIVLFDVKLHDHDGNTLYIVGTPNDTDTDYAEKWKMQNLMTEMEILSVYTLPSNLYSNMSSKDDYGDMVPIQDNIADFRSIKWSKLSIIRSSQQSRKKGKGKKKIKKSSQEFCEYAINAKDDEKSNNFRNIVLVDCEAGKYEPKPILLIKLGHVNWIGVGFNFDQETKQWNPKEILIDCYDIKSKMALYQPFENEEEYTKLENDITNLNVYSCVNKDNGCENCENRAILAELAASNAEIVALNEELAKLKSLLTARDKVIADQKKAYEELSKATNDLEVRFKVNQDDKL